ncbi:hypothetical protein FOA52_011295 [Chlamydomonas sp. UWO 241]|nr:hypothetical protein FOA52_011295 [Chlamydomonas sp. UWO 241]
MVATDELLSPAVLRQIGDKLYEKRKIAALEVEQVVKRLSAQGDEARIKLIVARLISEFAFSQQVNHRKGALLCLAAATVGLGEPSKENLLQIVPPVLRSFTDPDSRVRYYACEALYNIAKVARDTFLCLFNDVFDAMFRLCADSEPNVQNAVQFLDNLVKDIVTGNPQFFDIGAFIPKLHEYLRVVHPNKRQFLISWISVLDGCPDLDILFYLPQLLDGLLAMLSDPVREIRVAADRVLKEFLIEIHATAAIDFARLARSLLEKTVSGDELTRLTVLTWLKSFVEMPSCMGSGQLAPQYPEILGAVLANISHTNGDIHKVASETNQALLSVAPHPLLGWSSVDVPAILGALARELRSDAEPSRLEALRWVHVLLSRAQGQVLGQLPELLPPLLDSLSASSDPVVSAALQLLAAIAGCYDTQFRLVLRGLLDRFRGEGGARLLQRGGALVIRRLCGHMGGEKVFAELSQILDAEEDLAFASMLTQALNLILLTSPEVHSMREQLKEAATDPQGAATFRSLYRCWAHSTGAVLSLCFLAQAYGHAADIISSFRSLPMGAETLLQLDFLVALLETPCFTFLRLQLLQPRRHPDLLRCMYSLLMLLPQSNAWRTLNTRMQSIPIMGMMQLDGASSVGTTAGAPSDSSGSGSGAGAAPIADFPALLSAFRSRQEAHLGIEERRGGSGALAGLSAAGATAGAAAGSVSSTLPHEGGVALSQSVPSGAGTAPAGTSAPPAAASTAGVLVDEPAGLPHAVAGTSATPVSAARQPSAPLPAPGGSSSGGGWGDGQGLPSLGGDAGAVAAAAAALDSLEGPGSGA